MLYQCPVEPFCLAVLLRRVMRCQAANDSMLLQVVVEFLAGVFASSVALQLLDLLDTSLVLHQGLILLKAVEGFAFLLHRHHHGFI